MSGRLLALSLLLQAVGWGQAAYYSSPRFRVIPKSDGSAVGEAQFYGLFGSNYVALTAPNTVFSTIKWKLPSVDGAGALCSDGSANLYFGCAGGGGFTLNGLTASSQTLTLGNTGTGPNWGTSGGNSHILNLPLASTLGVTAGLISNTNFNTFNGKQDSISATGPITFVSNVVACPTCLAGYTVAFTATAGTLALRDGAGGLAGAGGTFQYGSFVPISGITALAVRRGSSGQTDPLQTWSDQTGTQLSAIDKDGKFTGNAATATALAANGANCSAGQAPLGVDASGAVEGCFTPAGGGNVNGSGTTVVGEVPTFTNTSATAIGPGYAVSAAAVNSSLASRNASGDSAFNIVYANVRLEAETAQVSPSSDAVAATFFNGSASPTLDIVRFADIGGITLSSIDKDGKFTGNAATATALAANGANCSAGQAPLGVDASGAVEGCFTPAGGGNVNGSGTTVVGEVPTFTNTSATAIGPGYAVSNNGTANTLARYGSGGGMTSAIGYWVGGTNVINSSLQGIFSAVSTFPTANNVNYVSTLFADNSLNKHATFRNSSGVELSAIDYQGHFTGLAATATAFAANPTNCSAGQAAAGVAADGTAEGCFTPAGGGDVSGPGSSTNLYYPQWSGTSGTSLGVGKAGASTTATASTVVERDSNGASKSWDKGAQFHNVMAYGATGNGSTDDRSAIQSAIDAETYGGVVYLPPGDFVLNSTHPSYSGCGLVIGNGTTSAYSSQNAITLQGSGGGVGEDFSIGNSTRGATRIKSGTSSITKLVCLVGPVVKVWLRDFLLDGNALTATGIEFLHVAESGLDRVNFRRFTTGWGMDFTVRPKDSGGWAFYSCGNKLTNFSIGEPSNTAFSGIRLSGVYDSDAGPYHTSCSNVFERFGVSFGTGSGAVGVELAYADNNKFINGGFSSYSGGGAGSGKPVNFTQQSDGASGANFPYGNKFFSIDSNHSQIYYGTNGDRGNFVLAHTEAEGNADPNLARLYWITDWGRAEVDATNAAKFYRARASTGTEIYSLARGGVTGAGVEINAYNEIQFKNPSFTEAYLKVRPSTSSNPGACSATNEGWFWVKAASSGVATTLTMCAANSSGVYDWRTVATF